LADAEKIAADDPRVLPSHRCGGRMMVIETFDPGCQPANPATAPQPPTSFVTSWSDFLALTHCDRNAAVRQPRLASEVNGWHCSGDEDRAGNRKIAPQNATIKCHENVCYLLATLHHQVSAGDLHCT
jgi:hypothetical protein